MRKFGVIFKEKQEVAETLKENAILRDFKKVYSALLEKYEIKSVHDLDEKTQNAFITEVSNYWDENIGLTEKGSKFLRTRSTFLNENSTVLQKKNFLKSKLIALINETLRQTELKWKVYDILDEMYKETKSKRISDVLSPEVITSTIDECFKVSLKNFENNIKNELSESAKPEQKFVMKIDSRKK